MLAVSDTAPPSNLASIGRLGLLKAQFPEIRIPRAVFEELNDHPDPATLNAITVMIRSAFLRVEVTQNAALIRTLQPRIHRGEAEVIALAVDLKADIVLMDEKEGRAVAAHAGFAVVGVLGILLRAKAQGQLPAIKPEIDSLCAKAGFFVSRSLEQKVLAMAGEPQG